MLIINVFHISNIQHQLLCIIIAKKLCNTMLNCSKMELRTSKIYRKRGEAASLIGFLIAEAGGIICLVKEAGFKFKAVHFISAYTARVDHQQRTSRLKDEYSLQK
jgi:membrane protein CcdC involved in cytochrome C biogenesis